MDSESSTASSSNLTALEQYASFPFDDDDEYQNGLDSLIAGGELSLDAVREYELAHAAVPATPQRPEQEPEAPAPVAPPTVIPNGTLTDASDSEPVVLSFAQLKALIEAGKEDEIPNNKVIPDGLNDEAPSVLRWLREFQYEPKDSTKGHMYNLKLKCKQYSPPSRLLRSREIGLLRVHQCSIAHPFTIEPSSAICGFAYSGLKGFWW
uniref:Peroxisomal membrane protein PEX14-like KPWE domain-containing protein n=1 Tax=Mycena chlorophos TaxID=658473 RepID=A0ABQ0LP63_MYCCL|nr:predicted protein [Mycena chlorophos]